MKYGICILYCIVVVLLPNTTLARDTPLPYTISQPQIIEKKQRVTIAWNQTQPVLVMVYKLSYVRKLSNNCSGVETFGANCTMIWQRKGLTGNMRVTDKSYRKGDEYYIQQNVYQSHNGGYGPFIPQ